MNKEQEILFWSEEPYRETTFPPQPAIKQIPNWWKKRPRYQISNEISDLYVSNEGATDVAQISLKHCMPFLDSLSFGYHYVLPFDIEVKLVEGRPEISWDKKTVRPVELRGFLEVPVPHGHYPVHYIWDMRWGLKTPEGYSCLITHPLNRFDLPFITLSGIIDTDNWHSVNAISFFIREGFEGVIEQGTPLFQIVPFKRDDWLSKIDHSIQPKGSWDLERKKTKIFGYYKKERWARKNYK